MFGNNLVILLIFHLIGDWVFQPYHMAANKGRDPQVRLLHVLVYTITMIIGLSLIGLQDWKLLVSVLWLAVTHYAIDSYKPLYWFRHYTGDPFAATFDTYKAHWATPHGLVVYIGLDQVFHLLCLVPLALL